MEWDALGRLRKIYKNNNTPGSTGDDVLVGEYLYDTQNRRVRKVVTNSGGLNGTTDFYYDDWRVLEEHDGSDSITNQYTYGNYLDEVWTLDRRAGFTVPNLNDNTGVARHFYLSNTLYSVAGLTNEGSSTTPGTLREAYQYDAYGKQTVITDGNDADAIVNFTSNDVRTPGGASTINNSAYLFTGQRFDAESGLLYFKNRYLSTESGRWIQRDPTGYFHRPSQALGNQASIAMNLYEYVSSNPTGKLDPLGTDEWTLTGAKGVIDWAWWTLECFFGTAVNKTKCKKYCCSVQFCCFSANVGLGAFLGLGAAKYWVGGPSNCSDWTGASLNWGVSGRAGFGVAGEVSGSGTLAGAGYESGAGGMVGGGLGASGSILSLTGCYTRAYETACPKE